jgi:hypothetical protein
MSLRFENNLLDLWFEGSRHADQRGHDQDVTSAGLTDRDQVIAVMQALERHQREANGTSCIVREPINEVARAFLLSSPPSATPNVDIPPSVAQKAAIPPSAKQSTIALNPTRSTANPLAGAQTARIEDPGRLTNDSLIKSRFASTVLKVARISDPNTAARLVSAISRDLPLHDEIPEFADVHRRAIVSFDELATSLAGAQNLKQEFFWNRALDAAAEWLRAVEPSGHNAVVSRHADLRN